jgi:hypothetical protein
VLIHPFQQSIIEKIFGVSTYTANFYVGLYLSGSTPTAEDFNVFDSGVTLVALPAMEMDTVEVANGYPSVSNAAVFDVAIDANVTVDGWYVRQSNAAPDATRADLAFLQPFSLPMVVATGDILRWGANDLVVEFW